MDKIWSANHIPIKLKMNIFEASVLSILLYGCETWTITPQLEQRINSFATNCYRQMLDIKREDKIKLDNIYAQVNRRPLIYTINKRQLGWLGHTLRRDKDEPTTILALYGTSSCQTRSSKARTEKTHIYKSNIKVDYWSKK